MCECTENIHQRNNYEEKIWPHFGQGPLPRHIQESLKRPFILIIRMEKKNLWGMQLQRDSMREFFGKFYILIMMVVIQIYTSIKIHRILYNKSIILKIKYLPLNAHSVEWVSCEARQ